MLAYQQAFGQGLVSYASAISVVILVVIGVMSAFYLTLYRRVATAA
jgi:ABC-type sugar transport system permease subunit